jgi:hypothetical protein
MVGIDVTLETRIREVLSSHVGRDASYADSFSWFSSVITGKFRNSASISPRRFLADPFQFIMYLNAPFDAI